MIVGVGIDLVEIERVRSLLERQGAKFVDRILADDEGKERLGKTDGPAHVAGLFAAKEAVMKALGTGMAGAAFKEIRIRHTDRGQPLVELSGEAATRAQGLGIAEWRLSITHTRTTAAAVAIAVG